MYSLTYADPRKSEAEVVLDSVLMAADDTQSAIMEALETQWESDPFHAFDWVIWSGSRMVAAGKELARMDYFEGDTTGLMAVVSFDNPGGPTIARYDVRYRTVNGRYSHTEISETAIVTVLDNKYLPAR